MTDELYDGNETHPEWEMREIGTDDRTGEPILEPVDKTEERFGPWTGLPQIEQQPETVDENTDAQAAALLQQERQAALEQTWPLWEVVIQGAETLWVARPGQNISPSNQRVTLTIRIPSGLDENHETTWVDDVVFDADVAEGEPMPWVAPNKGTVEVLAPNADYARMMALRANPDYHKVLTATKIRDGKK